MDNNISGSNDNDKASKLEKSSFENNETIEADDDNPPVLEPEEVTVTVTAGPLSFHSSHGTRRQQVYNT